MRISVEHAQKLIREAAQKRYIVVKKIGRRNYVVSKVKPCPSAAEIASIVLERLPSGKPFKLSMSYVRRVFEEATKYEYLCDDKEIRKAVNLLHEMLRGYRVAKLTRGALYEIQ